MGKDGHQSLAEGGFGWAPHLQMACFLANSVMLTLTALRKWCDWGTRLLSPRITRTPVWCPFFYVSRSFSWPGVVEAMCFIFLVYAGSSWTTSGTHPDRGLEPLKRTRELLQQNWPGSDVLLISRAFLHLNQTSGYVMTAAELSRHFSPWFLLHGCCDVFGLFFCVKMEWVPPSKLWEVLAATVL